MCGSSCGTGCAGCKAVKAVAALLMTLATVGAFVAVWRTHVVAGGLVFGTMDGSLALLTFMVGLTFWTKMVGKMCPCNKGGCGSSCASGCGCGEKPGMMMGKMK